MIDTCDGVPNHGPDDLMDIPIAELAYRLARRVRRLAKFEKMNAPQYFIRKEKHLIRVAQTAARARVREMAELIAQLLDE